MFGDIVEDIDMLEDQLRGIENVHHHAKTNNCPLCAIDAVLGLLQDIHVNLARQVEHSDIDIYNFSVPNPVSGTKQVDPAGAFPLDQRMASFICSVDQPAIIKVELIGPGLIGNSKVILNQAVGANAPLPWPGLNQIIQRGYQFRWTITFSGTPPTLFGFSADLRPVPSTNRNLFRIERP